MKYERPKYLDPSIKTYFRKSAFSKAGGFTVPNITDRPISIRENFRRAMMHENPAWVPNSTTDFNFAMLTVVTGMPEADWTWTERTEYKDWFGVEWMYVPEAGGPMLKPNTQFLDDITDWKEKVKFPNLDEYDIEGCCKKWLETCDPEKVYHVNIGQGCTERLVALRGGYTDAMCDMALEPEAVREFLEAFVDWEIQLIDKLCEYLPLEYVTYHDDWGTERDSFFSEAMMDAMVYPPTKRLFDHIRSKGVFIELHSCGCIKRFVPYMIDLGVSMMQIQARANDFKAYKAQYGDKIGIEVGVMPTPGMTKDEAVARIHEIVDDFSAGGGMISSFMSPDPELLWDGTMELYYYSREKYEGEA
ncbi:MAG: hypothetical protein MJ086_04720 [Lachnospiraceae bacterium]|nr:hypothetical protein [Lachnospiraceae bacterium]